MLSTKWRCCRVPPPSIALFIPNTSKHRLHVWMKPPCEPSPEYRELPCRPSRGGGCARPWGSGSARQRSWPRPSCRGWRGQAALSAGLRWRVVVVVVVVVRGRICRTGASCCRSFGNWLTFAERGMIIQADLFSRLDICIDRKYWHTFSLFPLTYHSSKITMESSRRIQNRTLFRTENCLKQNQKAFQWMM